MRERQTDRLIAARRPAVTHESSGRPKFTGRRREPPGRRGQSVGPTRGWHIAAPPNAAPERVARVPPMDRASHSARGLIARRHTRARGFPSNATALDTGRAPRHLRGTPHARVTRPADRPTICAGDCAVPPPAADVVLHYRLLSVYRQTVAHRLRRTASAFVAQCIM